MYISERTLVYTKGLTLFTQDYRAHGHFTLTDMIKAKAFVRVQRTTDAHTKTRFTCIHMRRGCIGEDFV